MSTAPHDDTEPAQKPAGDAAPSPATGRAARRPRRAVRRGTERASVPGASADERADGWGEAAPGAGASGANDDRLLRDVPPHYGRH